MTDHYGYLRSCAGCSAHLLTYRSQDRDEAVLCAKCEPGLVPGDELAQKGKQVKLYCTPTWRTWVVLARDGEQIEVRPLGCPEHPSHWVHVRLVKPEFSYTRLEQARRAAANARRRAS